MRCIQILLINLLWLLCTVCLAGDGGTAKRAGVVKTYQSQIGVREATGRNDGVQVESYLRTTNLKKGHAWCAAFVNWCFINNQVPTNNSAWAPAWFPKSKTVYTQGVPLKYVPQPGDVFGLYYPNLKRIGHVGFINKWGTGSSIETVEGNTNGYGSREGNGVYVKWRMKSQISKVANWIDQ